MPDAELALAAVSAGAAVVRATYGASLTRLLKTPDVDGPPDFATEADVEAERAITSLIRTARPGDGVLGEEQGLTGPAEAARTWLVDPLCGTLNFAARTPLVAVNVALRVGDEVSAAAVADPLAGEAWWTDGEAAWVRRLDDPGSDRPAVPDATSGLVDVNLDAPYPNGRSFRAVRLLGEDGFAARFRPRVLSTTLALAWVADGRRAAYLTDGDLRDSVHFAAGIALCQAAGCVVTGLRGQPLHTGVGGLVVAADGDSHAALVGLVERQFAG
ncbi:MAG TPA: inositol monophosphatase family protein [Nocardioides sp.]